MKSKYNSLKEWLWRKGLTLFIRKYSVVTLDFETHGMRIIEIHFGLTAQKRINGVDKMTRDEQLNMLYADLFERIAFYRHNSN